MNCIIGLIGDFNAGVTAHQAIPLSLELAAARLQNLHVQASWVGTETIRADELVAFNGLWCVPASPYNSMEGALKAIHFARTNGVPFLGTCGGFQHALLEYARNQLGLAEAEHAESCAATRFPLISRLTCSLVERQGLIYLKGGSRIRALYNQGQISESYRCNFGLNPAYESLFNDGVLQFTGRSPEGEVRALELANHPFFFATLFQPERSALRGERHPIIHAFVEHAVKFQPQRVVV